MERRIFILLSFALFVSALLAALFWVFRVSFGLYPLLDGTTITTRHIENFVNHPLFMDASLLSALSALVSTALSLVLSFALFATLSRSRALQRVMRFLAPVLAVPHALLAMAMIVLMAPTGWLVRWFWWLSSTPDLPPQFNFAPDSWGIGMVIVLVIKETAFLLLILLGHLENDFFARQFTIARSLGYAPIAAWCKVLVPQLYPRIRLPVLAVLIYSASTVEVPLITNSFHAPTLAVIIFRYFQHADLHMLFLAAAGSLILLLLCLGLIVFWLCAEKVICFALRFWVSDGGRCFVEKFCPVVVLVCYSLMLMMVGLGFVALLLHGLSFRWAFPDILPESGLFSRPDLWWGRGLLQGVGSSITIAVLSSLLALALSVVSLLSVATSLYRVLGAMVYLPMLLPQIATMMGVQLLLLQWGLSGNLAVVVFLHTLFVLPYTFISLAGAVRSFDQRYILLARSFGLGWWQRLIRVIVPMLLRPLMIAFAVGFAVSQAQFLTTLLASGGRTETVMTYFMLVAAGGNMREIAQVGLVLVLLVAVPFWLSVWVPAFVFRSRRGMRLQD